jgi:hypothetical protein
MGLVQEVAPSSLLTRCLLTETGVGYRFADQ